MRAVPVRPPGEGGFSLVELLVAVALLAVIGSATTGLVLSQIRAERFATEQRLAMDQARVALDRVRAEVRGSRQVLSGNAGTLRFWLDRNADGVLQADEDVSYGVVTAAGETTLQRWTAAQPTRRVVARRLSAATVFSYAPLPPATRVVTISLEVQAQGAGGPTPLRATDRVRLRNVD